MRVRVTAAAAALLLTLTVGCQPKGPDAGPKVVPAVPVTVAPVAAKTVRRAIPVTGTLNGQGDVTVSPKVDGQVVTLWHDIGDEVLPGEVLLELDTTDYELAVRQARSEVNVQEKQVAVAKAQLAVTAPPITRAKANYERVKGLPAASGTEKDTAEAEYESAKANKLAAEAGVEAAEAGLEVRRRAVAVAEQRLADASLRAPQPAGWGGWAAAVGPAAPPFRYTVAAKMVSEGEMVRSFPGTNAYRLVVSYALKLRVTVPEKHSPEVKVGQPVDVRVEAFPAVVFPGTVARLSPTVDPQTRTFQVEVAVPNPDGRLKAGGFARADVVVGTAEAVVIPPNALVVFAGVSKVYVADGDKAREVRVEVGDRGPDWVEVKGDLKPGQQVITSGFIQLFDGAAITLRK